MVKLNALDWIALVLVIVGALNWGLVGIFTFNLVAALFGEMTVLSRIIYTLVGIAGIYIAIVSPKLRKSVAGAPTIK